MKKENINKEITRKEAIKKMGKYAAFTAIGTFAVLNPLSAQNTSTPLGGGNDEDDVIIQPTTPTIDSPTEVTPTSESRVGTKSVESNFIK